MATRNLLNKNRLNEFRQWCVINGLECQDGRGDYQVLQVKIASKWYALYERAYMPEYLTAPLQLLSAVRRFIASTKK